MSGNTVTQPTAAVGPTTAPVGARQRPTRTAHGVPLSQSRAARELGLKRREFDLAVHLGLIRTIVDDGGGGPRVTPAEIDRVRSEDGFPEALKDRIKIVGTAEGAALMEVTSVRFTRLARLGHVGPVDYYLNRYRAVVWLYRAEELHRFAADERHAHLLSGRTPEDLRDQLDAGLDLRARTWRERHLGFLLNRAQDPWARAAALASFLDPVQIAELVRDPYERAYVNRLRPARPARGAPDSPAAQATDGITTADDPDEILRLRAGLRQALVEAREHRLAPRPAVAPVGNPRPVLSRTGAPGRAVECRAGTGEAVEPRPSPCVTQPCEPQACLPQSREPQHCEPQLCEAPRKRRGLFARLRRGSS
ncbi:DUF6397 family protein [Streptomyces poonensis]|uniref:Uncharacterized protein n=1 Tax=Streptomyces poonensis TaxID=68255 RepID=A0A918UUD7_9ACTN|nr:DUF6397 family protein [Streptomyces poonensis]GGZ34949.1 hypothetical protein GCM10010365_64690 [Streptomyces poonensis]GLJ89531.1 hypothetical protein GCM10017589_21310 [Streptomyces poonensis]